MRLLILFALLCLGVCRPASAGFQAYHIDASNPRLALKGDLSDPLWAKAPVYDQFYENTPRDKVAASLRTEIRVAYDERYFYLGMRAFDAKPELIRAPFARRDKTFGDQDFLMLFLDPNGSKKSAQFIRVNPQGSISDGSYTDANGEDFAPDFSFDVATGRFDGGWTAEVRIPFSSLPYPSGQSQPWNLLVLRNMLREDRVRMTSAPAPRDTNCLLCFATPIEQLHDLPGGLSWTATPQITTGTAGRSLSLDAKLRLDPGTTVDLTIKPDFSQVELDQPVLSGNTRFGIFQSEKRPFFLEGADLLVTPQQAIYTRTIGAPDWGVRLTRRSKEGDFTFLTAHDKGGGLTQLPGPYGTRFEPQDEGARATILRGVQRRGDTSIGGVFTERKLDDGHGENRVFGPDLVWQQGDGLRATGQFLASQTRTPGAAMSSGHAALVNLNTSSQDWYVDVGVQDVSRGFRADNGFFSQAGFRDLNTEVRYKFGPQGPFNLFNQFIYAERKIDDHGALMNQVQILGLYALGARDSVFKVQIKPGELVRVSEGGALLRLSSVWGHVSASPSRLLSNVTVELGLGQQVDVESARVGHGGNAVLSAMLRPSDRLELEPSLTRSWINGAYREQALALNGIAHFSARDSLRMILQRTRTERGVITSSGAVNSLVYAHTRSLGTALYAGLSTASKQKREVFLKGSWQI